MGVATCQISGIEQTSTSGEGSSVDGDATTFAAPPTQTSVGLVRGIGGVPVVDSTAFARFNSDNQTTYETFYWPTIPADVVTAARAFHDKLASPAALAAYKAKLPTQAQGEGRVVIRHRTAGDVTASAPSRTWMEYPP